MDDAEGHGKGKPSKLGKEARDGKGGSVPKRDKKKAGAKKVKKAKARSREEEEEWDELDGEDEGGGQPRDRSAGDRGQGAEEGDWEEREARDRKTKKKKRGKEKRRGRDEDKRMKDEASSGSAVPTKSMAQASAPFWSQSLSSSSPAVATVPLGRGAAAGHPHAGRGGGGGGGAGSLSPIRHVSSEEALASGLMPAARSSSLFSPYFGSRAASSLGGDHDSRPLQFLRVRYEKLLDANASESENVVAYLRKGKGINDFEHLEIVCELWTPGAELTQQQGTITKVERFTDREKRKCIAISAQFSLRSFLLASIRRYPSQRGEIIIRGVRFLLFSGDSWLDEWPRGKMAPIGTFKRQDDLAQCEAHLIWYMQNGPLPQISWGGLRAGFGGYFQKEIGDPLTEQSLLFLGRKMSLNETQLVDLSTVIPFTTFMKSRVSQWLVLAVKTIKEYKFLWDNYTFKTFLEQADAISMLKDMEAEPGDFLFRLPSQLARDSDTKFLAQREGANLVITLVALGNDRKLLYLKADVSREEREAPGFIRSKSDLRRVLCLGHGGQVAKIEKATCCFNRSQEEEAKRRVH